MYLPKGVDPILMPQLELKTEHRRPKLPQHYCAHRRPTSSHSSPRPPLPNGKGCASKKRGARESPCRRYAGTTASFRVDPCRNLAEKFLAKTFLPKLWFHRSPSRRISI
ncbi:hypothetical protein L3X38_006791 [Prunus dulcis]|uniref:Uncharacterized protein n=1 Tax=Prunus dulcis TaxID=3755 RepID=A0AAD5F5D5_PRUDU|nr:hypothetical protein L3X38_006791 [Prunus dulcis]